MNTPKQLIQDNKKKILSDYIKITPLDIAINNIPLNYEQMINDKKIRTSCYDYKTKNFKIARDCILLDNIENKENIGYPIKKIVSNRKTYYIAYLPPIPSPFEQKQELLKLMKGEYLEQRISVGKHEKDVNRLNMINSLNDNLANEENTNSSGDDKMVKHRMYVEQYKIEGKNIQYFIDNLKEVINYLYNECIIKKINIKDKDSSLIDGYCNMEKICMEIIPEILNKLMYREDDSDKKNFVGTIRNIII